MESIGYHSSEPERKSDFVTVPYEWDDSGRPQVELPTYCPCGTPANPCHLRCHSLRERKTGPEKPLVVVYCATHSHYFTLYPLSYVPYSRARVAPVNQNGQVMTEEAEGSPSWEATLFAASFAAAQGLPWGQESMGLEPGTRTLRRNLEWAGDVLGLRGGRQEAERCADKLAVPLNLHAPARAAYAQATGLQARGEAVKRVVEALPVEGLLLVRVLGAGMVANRWGPAWWWRPGQGYLPAFQRWERCESDSE